MMKAASLNIPIRGRVPLRVALFLTLGRIVISPIFLIFYFYYQKMGITVTSLPYILLALLVVSEVSDSLDGYVARKFDQVTDLGKILDPMADSIARISVFLTFTRGFVQLPLLLVFVFLYRDVIISTLRTLCALRGVTLAARMSGKIKAVIQGAVAIVIVLLMIPFSLGMMKLATLQSTSLILVSLAALYTLLSGVEYIWANRGYIAKAWGKE
jgi:CDP-diacylglycerol---glycerol-3-phosphate 3-phosphatidyltransferase